MPIAVGRVESENPTSPAMVAVTCYRRTWRLVTAALVAASALGILLVLARLVLVPDPPLTVVSLALLATLLIVVPRVLVGALRRAFAATVSVDGDAIVIARRDLRLEIPRSAVVAVEPWTVPLPTTGATLRLRSGAPLGWELGLATPRRLVAFLVERADAAARTIQDDPGFRHADARGDAGTLRWWQCLLKFPVFALAPTLVLFRAHQWIAYGGTFGEYYQYGALPYVLTFLDYWTTVTIYAALWAGLWRLGAETIAWSAARLAPRTTIGVRRIVEWSCRLLYYGGMPVLLALRFLE